MGRFGMGLRNVTHVFDGYAKLTSVHLNGSKKACFSTSFIRTNFYRKSLELGDIAPFLLFHEADPPFTELEKLWGLARGIENTNTAVHQLETGRAPGTVQAVSDFWPFYDVMTSNLDMERRVDPRLPSGGFLYDFVPVPSSSHPLPEPGTENHINFYSLLNPLPGPFSTINLIRISKFGDREVIARIRRDGIPYMHSFAVSGRYAIVFAHPATIDVWRMLAGGTPLDSLQWHPERPTDVYVIHLKSRDIIRLQVPPPVRFNMHVVNSYEVGDRIYVDVSTYPDLGFIQSLELATIRDQIKRQTIPVDALLTRYVINMKSAVIHTERFPDTRGAEAVNRMDLPVINPSFLYKPYCYSFGLALRADGKETASTAITKKNVCQPADDKVWTRENHFMSEPWFQPRPWATAEDDGVVLSLVLDGVRRKSYIVMLDGRTLKPISHGYLPTFVPFNIHGKLFPYDS